jgi:phosphoribosylanthranilate isomerase
MKTKLKICGIRRDEDIEMINEILPEFIGFVFAKSKRQIDLKTAVHLKRKLNAEIKSVGVFVNETIDNIVSIVNSNAIDYIQLHGIESNDYIIELKSKVSVPIIKALIINEDFKNAKDFAAADFYLIDSGAGSGKTFNWDTPLNLNKPIFIAGGISLENIDKAYKIFKPYAFDLSSSVEIEGFKDKNKIREVSLKLAELNGERNE